MMCGSRLAEQELDDVFWTMFAGVVQKHMDSGSKKRGRPLPRSMLQYLIQTLGQLTPVEKIPKRIDRSLRSKFNGLDFGCYLSPTTGLRVVLVNGAPRFFLPASVFHEKEVLRNFEEVFARGTVPTVYRSSLVDLLRK